MAGLGLLLGRYWPMPSALLVTLVGLLATLLESVIGATAQRRLHWLTELVNGFRRPWRRPWRLLGSSWLLASLKRALQGLAPRSGSPGVAAQAAATASQLRPSIQRASSSSRSAGSGHAPCCRA